VTWPVIRVRVQVNTEGVAVNYDVIFIAVAADDYQAISIRRQ
jgi:hypothetical protein